MRQMPAPTGESDRLRAARLISWRDVAVDPIRAQNVKKLVGRPGYRLRVGDWRVIYTLDAGRLVVRVLDIGARGGVYQ